MFDNTRSDVYFRGLIDVLDDGLCLVDSQGLLLAQNATARKWLGYADAELLGRDLADTLSIPTLKPWLERFSKDTPSCLNQHGLFKRQDGSFFPVMFQTDPLSAPGFEDVTLLRFRFALSPDEAETTQQDCENQLAAILDTITDGVVITDEMGLIRLFNPAAEKLFGYSWAEVAGKNVRLLMPSPDSEAHDSYLANYKQTGVKRIIGLGREVVGKRKDGSMFPLYLSIGDANTGNRRMFVAILHNMTARKQVEEKLRTLSNAVEQSPNAIMIVNLDGMVDYVNPSYTKLTGYTPDELVGHSFFLLRYPKCSLQEYNTLKQTLMNGGEWKQDIQDKTKQGQLYWAAETIVPVRNANQTITHFLSIQQDITEQTLAQQALQASEERFRQVAEMTGEWLWEQNAEGRYIYSSGAVRQILGYEPEEIYGKSYLDLMTAEDQQLWRSQAAHLPQTQAAFYRLVNHYRHQDGHEVFTESSGQPFIGADGQIVKWRGVDHDITNRKRNEDALRVSERAIEAAIVGINIADACVKDHPNIYVNPALSHMTGYTREELMGRNLRILQGQETNQAVIQEMANALSKGDGCEVVLKNYRKDGTAFWNELLISPVHDELGKLTHWIGIQSDVTERRRAEEERHELEIAKEIQRSLLPKAPLEQPDLEVAGICLSANQVGGDYFDYFYSSGLLNLVIADVSGHSVGAALLMTTVRSTLKAVALTMPSPGRTLHALNGLLHEDLYGADLFISMFYLRYDPVSRRASFANAGHNNPLLIRENQSGWLELDAEGMILGVNEDVLFEEKNLSLQIGDKLMLYTDGVTEAQNPIGEFFGVVRLAELFARFGEQSPQSIIQAIIEALREFCGGQTFNDDVSLVIFKVKA